MEDAFGKERIDISTIPYEAPLAHSVDCNPERENAVQGCGGTLLNCAPADAFLDFDCDKLGVCP